MSSTEYKNFQIRPMLLEDLDQVCEIEPKAFGTHHWTRDNFVTELNNEMARYLVLESSRLGPNGVMGDFKTNLLAYAGAWIIVDEMHITTLGVDPDYRRQNLAEALIVELIELALKEQVRAITLEVRLSNIPAQKLYEKYGFQRQGMRKRYYEDNQESALLLWTEELQSPKFQELYQIRRAELIAKLNSQ